MGRRWTRRISTARGHRPLDLSSSRKEFSEWGWCDDVPRLLGGAVESSPFPVSRVAAVEMPEGGGVQSLWTRFGQCSENYSHAKRSVIWRWQIHYRRKSIRFPECIPVCRRWSRGMERPEAGRRSADVVARVGCCGGGTGTHREAVPIRVPTWSASGAASSHTRTSRNP